MNFERLARLSRTFSSVHRDVAVAELQRIVQAQGDKAEPDLVATLVGWLVSCRRNEEAGKLLNQRLRQTDPWRAAVETLMLEQAPEPGALNAAQLYDEGRKREPLILARLCIAAGKWALAAGNVSGAREWLLQAARHARAAAAPEVVAAAMGLLGNVFLYGQRPDVALDLYALDAGLVSLDGAYSNLLRIYRAHCYVQLDQLDVARGLYEEAISFSHLEPPHDARIDRALAACGSVWLEVLGGLRAGRVDRAVSALERQAPNCEGFPVLQAHLLVARSQLALCEANEARSRDLVADAAQEFRAHNRPLESLILENHPLVPTQIPACPSVHPNVCDAWLLDEVLHDLPLTCAAAAKSLLDRDPASFAVNWTKAVMPTRGSAR